MTSHLRFRRDFRRYSGGHGKVWDYFRHANAHPRWRATAYLTPDSVAADNPWREVPALLDAAWQPADADALFLGGMDWADYPADAPARPVINLVQHVRHADPSQPLYQYLSRRAIRICVSTQVAEAILATGRANGPVRVIEAALDLPRPAQSDGSRSGVFIGALKQPRLGRELAAALRAQGREVELADAWQPRGSFLAMLGSARVAVLLPNPTEGFYLPALEAMSLGAAVVVPDCVGNRAYLQPGENALVPPMQLDALLEAVARLDDTSLRRRLADTAEDTARHFDQSRERAAFHAVLDDLEALWKH